jgi:hypothetical protein
VLDADTLGHAMIGGNLMWTCGHINTWPGIDTVRAFLGPYADPARYPCPRCGAIGIIGTTHAYERPDVPRAE